MRRGRRRLTPAGWTGAAQEPAGDGYQHCLGNWKALTRYASDGKLEIDNNASERDLRPVAIGRNNYLSWKR